MGYTQIIYFYRIFPCKPSIVGLNREQNMLRIFARGSTQDDVMLLHEHAAKRGALEVSPNALRTPGFGVIPGQVLCQ